MSITRKHRAGSRTRRGRRQVLVTLASTLTLLALAVAPADTVRAADEWPLRETTVEQMPPQMARAYVRALQAELNARGYPASRVDGVAGPRTREAIRMYQHDAGLPATGRASKELLEHIKFADPLAAGAAAPKMRPMPGAHAPAHVGEPQSLLPPSLADSPETHGGAAAGDR